MYYYLNLEHKVWNIVQESSNKSMTSFDFSVKLHNIQGIAHYQKIG